MRREASRSIVTNEQSNNAQAHLEGLFLMDFKKELDDHFNNKLKPRNVNGVDFGGKSYIIIKDCIQSYLDATTNSSSPRQYKPDSEDDDLNRSKVLQKKKITLIISKLLELDSPNTDLKTKHAYICTFYNVLSRKACDYYWYNEKKYSKHYLLKAKEDFELLIGGTENEIHKQFLSIINDFTDKKVPQKHCRCYISLPSILIPIHTRYK